LTFLDYLCNTEYLIPALCKLYNFYFYINGFAH